MRTDWFRVYPVNSDWFPVWPGSGLPVFLVWFPVYPLSTDWLSFYSVNRLVSSLTGFQSSSLRSVVSRLCRLGFSLPSLVFSLPSLSVRPVFSLGCFSSFWRKFANNSFLCFQSHPRRSWQYHSELWNGVIIIALSFWGPVYYHIIKCLFSISWQGCLIKRLTEQRASPWSNTFMWIWAFLQY